MPACLKNAERQAIYSTVSLQSSSNLCKTSLELYIHTYIHTYIYIYICIYISRHIFSPRTPPPKTLQNQITTLVRVGMSQLGMSTLSRSNRCKIILALKDHSFVESCCIKLLYDCEKEMCIYMYMYIINNGDKQASIQHLMTIYLHLGTENFYQGLFAL